MDRKHKAENKISESSFLSVKVRSFFIENESSNVRTSGASADNVQSSFDKDFKHNFGCVRIPFIIERRERMLKVAVFDEEHEKDLQHEINEFLKKLSEDQLVDIKYDVSAACDPQGEQLYCFSALILYRA